MHPRSATLVGFCDGEASAYRSRRIARHLAKCERCRGQLVRIQSEKDQFSAGAPSAAMDHRAGLDGVLSAIAAWQGNQGSGAASELRARIRWQIEIYFGSPAVPMVERPGMRAEELLGKAGQMLEVFLGPSAAEAVRDDVLRGMDWAGRAGETCR